MLRSEQRQALWTQSEIFMDMVAAEQALADEQRQSDARRIEAQKLHEMQEAAIQQKTAELEGHTALQAQVHEQSARIVALQDALDMADRQHKAALAVAVSHQERWRSLCLTTKEVAVSHQERVKTLKDTLISEQRKAADAQLKTAEGNAQAHAETAKSVSELQAQIENQRARIVALEETLDNAARRHEAALEEYAAQLDSMRQFK